MSSRTWPTVILHDAAAARSGAGRAGAPDAGGAAAAALGDRRCSGRAVDCPALDAGKAGLQDAVRRRSGRRATGTCSSPAPAARWRRRFPRTARCSGCWPPPSGAGWTPTRRCGATWPAPIPPAGHRAGGAGGSPAVGSRFAAAHAAGGRRPTRPARGRPSGWPAPLDGFAARALEPAAAAAARGRAPTIEPLPAAALHGLRLHGKRLRYACEFFAPLFPGRGARTVHPAADRAAGAAGPPERRCGGGGADGRAGGGARLRGRGGARLRGGAGTAGARGRIGRSWRKFHRLDPFWD